MALCLCALPALMARSLSEEELLATRMLLDVPTEAMSLEEAMVMQSGMYGSGSMGGYGGLPAEDSTSDGSAGGQTVPSQTTTPTDPNAQFESAQQSSSSSATPSTTTKTASSASSAQLSFMAGAVAAAAILML